MRLSVRKRIETRGCQSTVIVGGAKALGMHTTVTNPQHAPSANKHRETHTRSTSERKRHSNMPDAPCPTTDNTVALAAHGDDSYCALCRRCQMRKKLERRLATRRRGTTTHKSAEHEGIASAPRDERPIAELLDYIGADDPNESGGVNGRPGRKARRKRAAAMRRRALAEKDNVVVVANTTPSTSEDGGVGCGSCDNDDSNSMSTSTRTTPTAVATNELQLHHVASKFDEGNSNNNTFDYDYDVYDEDVDREVEEFRRLLEAAHANRREVRGSSCMNEFSH